MLKLRQWTTKSSSSNNSAAAAAASDPASPTSAVAGGGGGGGGGNSSSSSHSNSGYPNNDASPSVHSSPISEKGQSAASFPSKTPSILDNASKTGSDDISASASVLSQPTQEEDETDPDALLEREIEKRKTGNSRLNGAVEALWSALSKKKALPYDMTNAQLAAVMAKLKEDDEDGEAASKTTNGKRTGGVAAVLADLLPGSGSGKDKEKIDSKMVPINALGIAMTSYSEALAASTAGDANSALPSASNTQALGTSLGLLGRAYIQIAQLQTAFASDIKSVLLTRLARSHVQLDAYAGARKRADAARARLDAARSKAQKSKREKRELEDELRIASAAYDDAISELEMRAEAVLYTSEAEDLSALTDYLHSHLDFLHQSVECLERVKDNWAHVDDRALNRGINAGSIVSGLNSNAVLERPRSRTTSLMSSSANTVRARKPSSRPSTANSITAAMAAGAGRFGFPSSSRPRSETQDSASQKNGKSTASNSKGNEDVESDSGASEEEEEELNDEEGTTKRKSASSKKHRRKSSASSVSRPGFNRSLSRLGIFGGSKKDDGTQPEDGKDGAEPEKPKASSATEKEKSEDRPPTISRGWSDTFKAKAWKREKDRDTGGFASFGDSLPPGHHQQELDEEEKRRRADLLSGISIGIDDERESAPRLPKRQDAPRRTLSGDSYDDGHGPTSASPGARRGGAPPSAWATFEARGGGGGGGGAEHETDHSDFEDGARLGHIGRRDSSAATDIFRDGSGMGSPLGHSPFPSEGMGMGRMGSHGGEDGRMLAFNNTGLSALSAGEDDAAGAGVGAGGAGNAAAKRLSNPFGLPSSSSHPHFLQVHPQDTGVSLGGLTDPASHSHDEDGDVEQERAVLTSNGASSQTQRYRSGGVLSRMASGGAGGGASSGGAGGSSAGVTGARGAMPPPVPPSSTFLKNRAPPPPPPSRGTK
ncbi:hypothetical protein OC844_002553 [Tilletia horrida]|nr:hypothetical protein OC844_002553 [Tilletia horrida]